ncbi:NTP pyrophosphohydrolase [Brachybacterium vulturis]|uniref:NTP pyrophosphohydrolase n=1 Tax=Brachybacterium vulturis TaxID=2017484 RepID=A0A291GQE9_9MICO|nr:NUDIX domain-containing protein [Brachybacterium vulturis]ATG52465.1 NTP pyrophosphohydrolase [Brachybacterium vulturis]
MSAEPDGRGPSARGPAVPEAALAELVRAEAAVSGPAVAQEFQELLAGDPRLMHRDGGPRHLTASAIVIDRPGDHVALLWHRKGRFWVQPGGHLEEGETSFEQAARREVAEEIGLGGLQRIGDGPAMLHRHALEAAFGACWEHWDVQYLLRAPAPAAELPLTMSEESPAVRWVPWPLHGLGPERETALPDGTVPDLAGTLEGLALYLARRAD